MCYIYLRLLFGIACLAYHTAITFALYQPLYPEFIVNSFDIKRAAAIFVQFACTLHGKHKWLYTASNVAGDIASARYPLPASLRISHCHNCSQSCVTISVFIQCISPICTHIEGTRQPFSWALLLFDVVSCMYQ